MQPLLNYLENYKIYLLVALVLLLGGGIYFFAKDVEMVEKHYDLGFNLRAKQNPLLAAELFLESQGLPTESSMGLGKLEEIPQFEGTLVISGSRLHMGQRRNQILQDWIQDGGHLITTVQTIYDEEEGTSGDPLVDELGVRQYINDYAEEEEGEEEAENEKSLLVIPKEKIGDEDKKEKEKKKLEKSKEKDKRELLEREDVVNETINLLEEMGLLPHEGKKDYCEVDPEKEEKLSTIYFEGAEQPLQIRFDPRFYMQDFYGAASLEKKGYYGGAHLLQYEVGNGLFTVLTDDYFLQNKKICLHDHAYLLWLLTKDAEKVWFLYSTDAPSLFTLIWIHGAPFVISCAFLLVALLWWWGYRFGTILPAKSAHRRQLMEHIETTGHFIWKNQKGELLLEKLRNDIEDLMETRHRGYGKLSISEKQEMIHQTTKVSRENVLFAFTQPNKLRENEFFRSVQSLQAIRKNL